MLSLGEGDSGVPDQGFDEHLIGHARISVDHLRTRHERVKVGDLVCFENRVGARLTDLVATSQHLRIRLESEEGRQSAKSHFVGQISGASRRLKFNREKECRRSVDSCQLEALLQSLSRKPLRRIITVLDVALPKLESRWIGFAIEEVVIMLTHKAL